MTFLVIKQDSSILNIGMPNTLEQTEAEFLKITPSLGVPERLFFLVTYIHVPIEISTTW